MLDKNQGEAEKSNARLEAWLLSKAKNILPDIEPSQPGTNFQNKKKRILYSGLVA
jgi:hypothetical protein